MNAIFVAISNDEPIITAIESCIGLSFFPEKEKIVLSIYLTMDGV